MKVKRCLVLPSSVVDRARIQSIAFKKSPTRPPYIEWRLEHGVLITLDNPTDTYVEQILNDQKEWWDQQ